MKEEIIAKLAHTQFRCPLCRHPLMLHGKSMLCASGHCYDIAASGYVNFLQGHRATQYDKEFFTNRKAAGDIGIFLNIMQEILHSIDAYTPAPVLILDAGCGDGYYAAKAQQALPAADIYALDIEKEAVKLAAKRDGRVKWMVADLRNIPLMDASVDCVLNILTPSDYKEFMRVLKPAGLLVKAVPGQAHFEEIRKRVMPEKPHENTRVVSHFQEYFTLLEKRTVKTVFPLNAEQAAHVLGMSPILFGIEKQPAAPMELDRITIDVDILIGRRRQRGAEGTPALFS